MITIRWTETIQYQQRVLRIPIPRIHNHPLCPVQAISHYFSICPQAPSDGPIFRYPGSRGLVPLSLDNFSKHVRQGLSRAGMDNLAFAGHSFNRGGGASWAYHAGLGVDTIRQIGD